MPFLPPLPAYHNYAAISAPSIQAPNPFTADWAGSQVPSITAAGAFENSPEFQQRAIAAWNAIQQGRKNAESGFMMFPDNVPGPIRVMPNLENLDGHMSWQAPPDAMLLLHTHPNVDQDDPSSNDIASAKQWKRPVYVMSRSGLYMIDAKGKTYHEKDFNWLTKQPLPQPGN